MNNQLSVFNFRSTEIRTVVIDGDAWFVASDVAKALNYAEAKDMTRVLDSDEQGRRIVPTPSGDQEMIIINESGMYHAVLKSRKPEAKPFRKWVTGEVIPAIRKTGRYEAQPYAVNPGDTLTKEEADMLRNMNTAAAERLPKEKRGTFLMAGWSKLKAHFKCEYRRIPRAEFTEALNIMARHTAEVQLLPTPTALHEEARKRALFAALEIERQLIEQFVVVGAEAKQKRWCVSWNFDDNRCNVREFLPDETVFSFRELDAAMRPVVDLYRQREIAVYAR